MGKKAKGDQLSMFNQGEELPLFTGSVYGAAPAPFVQVEQVKSVSMFPDTFDELAQAEQAKKVKRAKIRAARAQYKR